MRLGIQEICIKKRKKEKKRKQQDVGQCRNKVMGIEIFPTASRRKTKTWVDKNYSAVRKQIATIPWALAGRKLHGSWSFQGGFLIHYLEILRKGIVIGVQLKEDELWIFTALGKNGKIKKYQLWTVNCHKMRKIWKGNHATIQECKIPTKVNILRTISYLEKRNLSSETQVFFKQVCKVGHLLRSQGKSPYVTMKIRDIRARHDDQCSTRE